MKSATVSITKHSLTQKEAKINVVAELGKYYNNLYAIWNDYYLAPNTNGYFVVTQFMARGAKDVADSAKEIVNGKTEKPVPSIVLKYEKRNERKVVGRLCFIPPGVNLLETAYWSPEQKQEWGETVIEMVEDLNDLTVDVMEAVFAYWLQHKEHPEAFVEINVDYILESLGIKKKKSGNGRRGGYEKEQRETIVKQLRLLASIYAEVEGTEYGTRGQEKPVILKSPLILIDSEKHYLDDHTMTVKVMPGDLMRHALLQGMLALTPKKVLHYNHYRHAPEKRLERYRARMLRNNQNNGDYYKTPSVETLLEVMGLTDNKKDRLKKRAEKAFNTIAGQDNWGYVGWDDSRFNDRRWFDNWKNAKVIFDAPLEVVEFYRERIKEATQPKLKKKELSDIGRRLEETIKRLNLNPEYAAEQIGIDTSTLYRILAGKTKKPLKKTAQKIEKWLKAMEKEAAGE